jgi:hypothetical protein
MLKRILAVASIAAVLALVAPSRSDAGTTGALVGRVADVVSKIGLANATVTAVSPSQSATTTTDANGGYRFISLAPDTYVISAERVGYDPVSQSGITILADQTLALPFALQHSLKTIGRVSVRNAGDLIKPGTTSDVYSINAASQEAAAALGGPGGLNSAYSAIASVPGAVVQQGQQGWFQTVSIRGGDIDQVGYELDGIPVNRVYDNAPQSMLSNLGQQELQVYTGGTPATADASGIAGYINQVIKTGTYPGFVTLNFGVGGPQYYHKASFEIGGATQNRLFSYYVGIAGVNQDYRYIDNFNGASDPQFFYPLSFPGHFNLYDGTAGTISLAGGQTYAISNTTDRENVVNLHFGIPHRDGLKDDVQLLYTTSEEVEYYFSSIDDQGGPANVANAVGGTGDAYWHDGYSYSGQLFAPVNATQIRSNFFPNSPSQRSFESAAPNDARDYSDNGNSIFKLQYQHNFDTTSYLRLYGYSEYSNWFIGGPANQQFTNYYGAELNDYELPSHQFGFNASYSKQLSDKHQLTTSASITAAQVERRFSYGYPGNSVGGAFTNLVDTRTGHCYSYATGAQASCYDTSGAGSRGTFSCAPPGSAVVDCNGNAATYASLATPAISPAAAAAFAASGVSPQWLVTDNGFANTRLNRVSPVFSAFSLTDQWRPSDRLTINAGARVENYDDRLADTTASPARAFWFSTYNNEHCFLPGAASPVAVTIGGTDPITGATITGASPTVCRDVFGSGYLQANLANSLAATVSNTVVEPRFGFTYSLDPQTVVRGSFGIYARPVNTSWVQYDERDQDLAKFIGANFLTLGYNTPVHALKPDTSTNVDFSLEKSLPRAGLSFKLTPYYRATKNQLQPVPIGVGGVVTGFNVGKQTSYGLEFALNEGDFARNGFAARLAYTYTHSRITYDNFPSGTNVIDGLNQYIAEYNSYTSACATITKANSAQCGLAPGATNPNAQASFASSDGLSQIANPYYTASLQPLLDRSGAYTTYDQIPQPFTGENGYETPHVVSFILNYKHDKFALTPSLTFSSGASYGSPLAYPGYVPVGCSPLAGATGAVLPADPKTCSGSSAVSGLGFLLIPDAFTGRFDTLGAFKQPSRLTLNFAGSFVASPSIKFNFAATGLVDRCFQRGYPWDDKNICVYSQLPSGGAGLGPSGNFLSLASTPTPFRYPYGVFNNNLNTGFVGTVLPLDLTANVQIKL